ncbi:TRAP transporter large permease subunit [Cribrihabitans pelagius]|uniref:TRAP transporter large permease subunit n=1 Tax=Cribrihabitans pelagius TaxID=1765746 RepID=UPI003B59ACBC
MDAATIYPGGRVTLREVGLRNGLQTVRKLPSSTAKLEQLRADYSAGVRHFEAGAFLPVSQTPQFDGVRDLIKPAAGLGAHESAVALNERGAREVVRTPWHEGVNVVPATEELSRAKMGRSRTEAVKLVRRTKALASAGKPVVKAAIVMAFGCPAGWGDVFAVFNRAFWALLTIPIVMAVIFVMGMFFEAVAILLITAPGVLSALHALNIGLVWDGVLLMINLALAMITPPVGMNLFVLQGITGAPLAEVVCGAAPYVLLLAGGMLLLLLNPGLATWLPHSAGLGWWAGRGKRPCRQIPRAAAEWHARQRPSQTCIGFAAQVPPIRDTQGPPRTSL